jgi:hypothetical protein
MGASSGHIINLKQSILETFDIYVHIVISMTYPHLSAPGSYAMSNMKKIMCIIGWMA